MLQHPVAATLVCGTGSNVADQVNTHVKFVAPPFHCPLPHCSPNAFLCSSTCRVFRRKRRNLASTYFFYLIFVRSLGQKNAKNTNIFTCESIPFFPWTPPAAATHATPEYIPRPMNKWKCSYSVERVESSLRGTQHKTPEMSTETWLRSYPHPCRLLCLTSSNTLIFRCTEFNTSPRRRPRRPGSNGIFCVAYSLCEIKAEER